MKNLFDRIFENIRKHPTAKDAMFENAFNRLTSGEEQKIFCMAVIGALHDSATDSNWRSAVETGTTMVDRFRKGNFPFSQ